jgi:hypothetical protein
MFTVSGGYLQKGQAKCIRFRMPSEDVESLIWKRVEARLGRLCAGGERLVARLIQETWGVDADNPVEKAAQLRAQIKTINRKASSLVGGLSEAATILVREKLEDLGRERRVLEIKLADLVARMPSIGIDPKEVTADMRAYLGRLIHVRESGTLEQQKRLLRGLISLIEVNPHDGHAQVIWRLVPAPRSRPIR